jgi:DNA-binding XRE family transcriptional regulator
VPERITPLLRFLRALTVEQQKQFATEVGTTRVYLYQLAGQPHPNPKLQLALAIVSSSRKWGKKVMEKPLTLEDLLVGNTTGEKPKPPPMPRVPKAS